MASPLPLPAVRDGLTSASLDSERGTEEWRQRPESQTPGEGRGVRVLLLVHIGEQDFPTLARDHRNPPILVRDHQDPSILVRGEQDPPTCVALSS